MQYPESLLDTHTEHATQTPTGPKTVRRGDVHHSQKAVLSDGGRGGRGDGFVFSSTRPSGYP